MYQCPLLKAIYLKDRYDDLAIELIEARRDANLEDSKYWQEVYEEIIKLK